jgi:hypothetical protein
MMRRGPGLLLPRGVSGGCCTYIDLIFRQGLENEEYEIHDY